MTNWNGAFTQALRASRRAHWGNWGLSAQIAPGAVGILDPVTGEFSAVAEVVPGATVVERAESTRWEVMTEHVTRKEAHIALDGTATDPETGDALTAGLQIAWSLQKAGSLVSEFALESEAFVDGYGDLLNEQIEWLAKRAASVGMGRNGEISQGFGVVTSVLWARSGLNVAAMSDNTTFSVAGSVEGVYGLVGQGKASGSYASTTADKSVDKHLWPDEENTLAPGRVPIAFTFASFDGRLLMPNWTTELGSLQLVLNNAHGGSYIVEGRLAYDTPRGRQTKKATASGALIATIGSIPLDATSMTLDLTFYGFTNEHKHFEWDSPLGQWYGGTRHIDLYGFWPGATKAVDAEASVRP